LIVFVSFFSLFFLEDLSSFIEAEWARLRHVNIVK